MTRRLPTPALTELDWAGALKASAPCGLAGCGSGKALEPSDKVDEGEEGGPKRF
jgi:hypothetical protein